MNYYIVIKMIRLKEANKKCPLFVDWTQGTVTNKVTLVEENIKFVLVGEKHIPYVSKRIIR